MKLISKLIQIADNISEWIGKIISWLVLVVIFILVYEIVSRTIFGNVVPWARDMSYILGGSAILLGTAMALKNNKHVRVDIFYERLSEKKKAILDIVLGIIILIPLVVIGLIDSVDSAFLSWSRNEHDATGNWRVPIYPLKFVICIMFLILLIQGLGEIMKGVQRLLDKEGRHDC